MTKKEKLEKLEQEQYDKTLKNLGISTGVFGTISAGSLIGKHIIENHKGYKDTEWGKDSAKALKRIGIATGIAAAGTGALAGYHYYKHHKDKNKDD